MFFLVIFLNVFGEANFNAYNELTLHKVYLFPEPFSATNIFDNVYFLALEFDNFIIPCYIYSVSKHLTIVLILDIKTFSALVLYTSIYFLNSDGNLFCIGSKI